MRLFQRLLVVVVVPATLAAQDGDWTYRLDADQPFAAGDTVQAGEWQYTRMPPGWHITTTEQGVTLFPKERTVFGRWAIEAELFLFPEPGDAPFGVAIEAADSPEPGRHQLRFQFRRDGHASLVALHDGAEEVLVPWTADTGVKGHAGGVVKYVLRVTHEEETLAFAINGREMFAIPASGEDRRVMPGLRVGPGLNLHVSRYDLITPLAPARRR